MAVTAKAYGKVLVFGAYSLIEPGSVGLVVNVDKGTIVEVEETDSGKIVIDMSSFKISAFGFIDKGRFRIEKDTDELRFIKGAVEATYEYLRLAGEKIKDIKILTRNDPELSISKNKTGFGSSASSTVAAVAAILKLHGIEDRKLVYRIARYAHYKSQGCTGSGFDIAAACFGSHFFVSDNLAMDRYSSYLGCPVREPESFEWPGFFLPVLIYSGRPASTQDLVKKVIEYKKKNSEKYSSLMQDYIKVNIACRNSFYEGYPSRVKFFLEKSWEYRKALGKESGIDIEPERFTRFFAEMKENGAYTAGFAGAGGGDIIIALCKDKEDKARLETFIDSKKLVIFDDLRITNKGYELL